MSFETVFKQGEELHAIPREGETLHLALEDARRKAQQWRATQVSAEAEAIKQEEIVRGLESIIDKMRQPASLLPKAKSLLPATRRKSENRKPHGFWHSQLFEGIKVWRAKNVEGYRGPTKRELIRILCDLVPGAVEISIMNAINSAIAQKTLLYRAPDHLYVPGTEPPATVNARDIIAQAVENVIRDHVPNHNTCRCICGWQIPKFKKTRFIDKVAHARHLSTAIAEKLTERVIWTSR